MFDAIITDREGLTGHQNEIIVHISKAATITVRDLIGQKVRAELLQDRQAAQLSVAHRLDPSSAERHAIESFSNNGVFAFLDDAQLTDLDQEIEIKQNSRIEFLRIIPLKGG